MSKAQMIRISRNFLLYTFAKSPCIHARQLCHLSSTRNGKVVSHGHGVTLGRCYLGCVQSANDEDFLKFTSNSNCSIQPVSGVINKDCTEAECLYSYQCECLSRDTVLQSCEGTGASVLSTHHQPPPSITD